MPVINFKLSDDQKFQALWTLLNSEYTEEGGYTVTYGISDVYDDYALAFNYETGNYERIYYAKNDEIDALEITERKQVFVIDVTSEELETVNTLRKLNGDTYELVSENLTNADQNCADLASEIEKNSEYSAKIEELESTISTLNMEIQEKTEQYTNSCAEKDSSIEALNGELDALKAYKYNVELAQKTAVIDQYVDQLDDSIIETYRNKIDEYDVNDLDMRLTYELKKTNPAAFSKNPVPFVPKDEPLSGIEGILAKYRK